MLYETRGYVRIEQPLFGCNSYIYVLWGLSYRRWELWLGLWHSGGFFFMGCSIAGVVAVILFVVLVLALFIQIGGSGYRGLFGFTH